MTSHRFAENARQRRFRESLELPPGDPSEELTPGTRAVVLPLGAEDRNLFSVPGRPPAALEYFAERGIHWWRCDNFAETAGRPTRHLVSSQVACVNAFLPPVAHAEVLTAMMRETIDPELDRLVRMEYVADYLDGRRIDSLIEFEWAELGTTLEGTPITRGHVATSVDVLLVGMTRSGRRRAYLTEWKYCEVAGRDDRSTGAKGAIRRARYEERYKRSQTLSGAVPFEVALLEPTYQYTRMALLGDLMLERQRFGIDEFLVVSVCPSPNRAYLAPGNHPFLTHPAVGCSSLHDALPRLFRNPRQIRFTEPAKLIAAARAVAPPALGEWLTYMEGRYGW